MNKCKKAVEVGRKNRAGFADIGKAYSRMGKASVKMGNKEQAIAYLEDAQVIDWCYSSNRIFNEISCHQSTNYLVVSISETYR